MNAEFLGPLQVELVAPWKSTGRGHWALLSPLQFYSERLSVVITVPAGFITDFASVPKLPLAYGLFGGLYASPAVIHDFLCREKVMPRQKADHVFLEAMRTQNAAEIAWMALNGADEEEMTERKAGLEGQSQVMYAAVYAYSALRRLA